MVLSEEKLVTIKQKIMELLSSHTNIINKSQTFRQYITKSQKKSINNEERIVQPFCINFLSFLGYQNMANLRIEESDKGNKPDFASDLPTKNFILECKSSSIDDFKEKYGRKESPEEQLIRYMKAFDVNHGILFSLEKFHVYERSSGTISQNNDLSFSLVEFEEGKPTNIDKFLTSFYIEPLSREEKIRLIGELEKEDLKTIKDREFNTILKSLINQIKIEVSLNYLGLDTRGDDFKAINSKICEIRKQLETDNPKDEFLAQTSYIIMARILLVKCWEDYGIIRPPYTYNGGFKKYLIDAKQTIEDLYNLVLNKSQSTYELFNPRNPYLLLPISEDLIIDIFFEISRFDFTSLNYDVLGYIYEDYLDLDHRKKFGQFYTPNHVVNLILDRVGYKPDPHTLLDFSLFDPASGSGSFLLNAILRIIQSKRDGSDQISEYKRIVEDKVFGSEIMLFPYLISEINILIQISKIFKDIISKKEKLNVLNIFHNNSFNLVDKLIIRKHFKVKKEEDIIGDEFINPTLINIKKLKLKEFQSNSNLDFVVGNPPYVTYDRNPKIFQDSMKFFTFCQETYYNKMDLFYWFVILGILKLKPGGKLGFITTRYWIDKGDKTGVEKLKEIILKNCYIREVIDLRDISVFKSATGQENIIFVLQLKEESLVDEKIKIFKILPRPQEECSILTKEWEDEKIYCPCDNDTDYFHCLCDKEPAWDKLLTSPEEGESLSKYIKAFYSAKKTTDLRKNRSWPIYYGDESIVNKILNSIEKSCELEETFKFAGISPVKVMHIKDFYTIQPGVNTIMDDASIIPEADFLKRPGEDPEYFIRISKFDQTPTKEELLILFSDSFQEEDDIWIPLKDKEYNMLIPVYKTPAIYQHGLAETQSTGYLIFFENDSYYSSHPALVMYLTQYKKKLQDKLVSYKETSKKQPNKWISIRRRATIKVKHEGKTTVRNLFDYYKSGWKLFFSYMMGSENIFGITNKSMTATSDMYFFHKLNPRLKDNRLFFLAAYLNSKLMEYFFKMRPISIKRQKTNIENDIPIFFPKSEQQTKLIDIIINLEKILIKKMYSVENHRKKGIRIDFNNEKVSFDINTTLKKYKGKTIDYLSYKFNHDKEIDFDIVDRKEFPIIIDFLKPSKDIDRIQNDTLKILTEDDGWTSYFFGDFRIFVDDKISASFQFIIDNLFQTVDSMKKDDFLKTSIPDKTKLKELNDRKNLMEKDLFSLIPEDKMQIESIIDDILNDKEFSLEKINTVRKIRYFIDFAFIKMMVPEYKDEIFDAKFD